MRQCAWLNATPDREPNDKSDSPMVSRRKALEETGVTSPEMPPCDATYLVALLFEIGPSVAAGMGQAAIPHSEILAWQSNTGIKLTAWEAMTLRQLSICYVDQSYKSTEPDCEAPWKSEDVDAATKQRNSDAVRRSIRAAAGLPT